MIILSYYSASICWAELGVKMFGESTYESLTSDKLMFMVKIAISVVIMDFY